MYRAYEYYSSPGVVEDEFSYAQRLEEDTDALKKYKALQNSVCFLCLLSRGKNGQRRRTKPCQSGDYIEVIHEGRIVRVKRHIDLDRFLEKKLPVPPKGCPPACIGPVKQDLGVSTVDELDIFAFMECELASGSGILVDARTSDLHAEGTIPGSIHIPYTVFHLASEAPELVRTLQLLGATPGGQEDGLSLANQPSKNRDWDFSSAMDIVFWCNGPMGQQSPLAIRGLQKLGYPAHKISHYRGGIQLWKAFDLTTVVSV